MSKRFQQFVSYNLDSLGIFRITVVGQQQRWAPKKTVLNGVEWGPYQWRKMNWVTVAISPPISGIITPFITGRCPPCSNYKKSGINFSSEKHCHSKLGKFSTKRLFRNLDCLAPEDRLSEEESGLSTINFQVLCLFQGG